jgi:hypothetical protein
MQALLDSIKRVRPLDRRRERELPGDVRDLWAGLTRERDYRRPAYLSSPAALSAYLRYFLPWNVYRYLRLLPQLDLGFLETQPSMADFGAGPLSLGIALWLAFPGLRGRPLELRALDRVPSALDAGQEILADLAMNIEGKLPSWKIVPLRQGADRPLRGLHALSAAAYFLSELDQGRPLPARERAAHAARILSSPLSPRGRLLVIDSGDARAASMLSALRAELIAQGWSILSPCPHHEPCPMPGHFIQDKAGGRDGQALVRSSDGRAMTLARGKRPWCHFAFEPLGVPAGLETLSARAGLPKARASLSFIFARKPGPGAEAIDKPEDAEGQAETLRIVSESMPDPEGGRMHYCCGRKGYSLLRGLALPHEPGDLIRNARETRDSAGKPQHDGKTGALEYRLTGATVPYLGIDAQAPSPAPRAMPRTPKPSAPVKRKTLTKGRKPPKQGGKG